MTIDSDAYHVPPGKKLDPGEWPMTAPAPTGSKKPY